MNMKFLSAVGAAGVFCSCASAGVIIQSGSIPMSTTDWIEDFQINRFDDMGGLLSLDMVSWTLTGHIEGAAEIESMDAAPATVSLTLSAQVSLALGANMLDVVLPLVDASFDAAAFDGVIDFAGPSGASFSGLTSSDTAMNSTTDVGPFVGPGMLSLTGAAVGASTASGAGNLVASFSTSASMDYEVVYHYSVVPAPGGAVLLCLAGAAAARRRRG